MIKNYLVTSLRNLRRNWNFAAINIVGLTLGLACCLLIFFTVRYELSFDKHNRHAERIYRLLLHSKLRGDKGFNAGMPLPVLEAMRNDYPELKNAVTCTYAMRETLVTIGQGPQRKKFMDPSNAVSFIGPEYFQMFDYTWLKGAPEASLTNPGSVVLTESQAKKYFGTVNALGKTLKVSNRMDFIVTGILADPPPTTSFPFQVFLSFSSLKKYGAFTNWDDWVSSYGGGQIYLMLPESLSKESVEKSLVSFSKKYRQARESETESFLLQALGDIHYNDDVANYTGRSISKGMIWSMVLVGIFILVTACVNFINLATALALRRSREVGVRKVLGSTRGQLLRQYFSETALLTICSMALALILAQSVLPYISDILNIRSENVLFVTDPAIMTFLAILAVVTTLLAGFYPAMVVSGYQPILALKGKMLTSGRSQASLRKSLIVLQFTISQVVLLGTMIAYSQMKYFRTMDVGFLKDQVINVPMPDNDKGQSAALQAKLGQEPGIRHLSFSYFTPMSRSNWQTGFRLENEKEMLNFEVVMRPADTAYFNTYGLKLVAGRPYFHADTMREFVINEAFVKKMGYKNPADVLGKRLAIGGAQVMLPIVGVVKNFNTYTLHREIIPAVLTTDTGGYSTMSIKLNGTADAALLARIEKAWTALFPDHFYKYHFYDQTISNFYEKEEKLFSLFRILAGIAIFIGCLGLYGVVAFMAESRTKEMGIRKVIGASALHIFSIFSFDFIKLVVIALVLASPIAWYFMHQWMQEFTYKAPVSGWLYVLAGLLAIGIAMLTISFQSLRAALVNPVKSLRSE